MSDSTILITGATGFVGGQLLERLRETDEVRVIVRDASKLEGDRDFDVVEGDLDDDQAVRSALRGIGTAYYLVHSMEPGSDAFAQRDHDLAERFIRIAGEEDVAQVVYLGGVRPDGETSDHLASRNEVEDILSKGEPELVALQASMVVGARSDSFRTLAQIVSRLPVLALPDWRTTRTQPVGIDDVVAALVAARDVAPGAYEIAGPDEVTVEAMCDTIAEVLGKNRHSIPLPFSSSKLESAAAAVVADSDREVLEPLLAGLHEDLLVEENTLESVFGVEPTPFREAARRAMAEIDAEASTPA